MKLWQCSACRELNEDCKNQCQLITDDDITPTWCVFANDNVKHTNWTPIIVDDLLHGFIQYDRRKPTAKEIKLYQRAWNIFGQDPQLDMIVEECSELIKEVCKLKRHPDGSFVPILDEIVDVVIMCEQFLTVQKIYPAFHRHKRQKLIRLHIKLDKVEAEAEAEFVKFTQSFQKKARELYDDSTVDTILGKDEEKEVKKKDELWVVDPKLHAKRVN